LQNIDCKTMMLRAKVNVVIPSTTLAEVAKMSTDNRLAKLEQFFKEVADLTVGREVMADGIARRADNICLTPASRRPEFTEIPVFKELGFYCDSWKIGCTSCWKRRSIPAPALRYQPVHGAPMRFFVSVACSLVVALAIAPAATAQRFTVSTIPSPQGTTSLEAYSINQMGAVTGNVTFGSNSCAYIYADGILNPVCSLVDGQGGTAFSINNFQQVAGSSDGHGFIYSNGTVAEVGLLPQGTFSGLLSLNDYGQATGQADTDPNPFQGNAGRSHAILYSFSTRKLTDLGNLPTGDQSYGIGINNAGEVTG
jgi:hypothetical protein